MLAALSHAHGIVKELCAAQKDFVVASEKQYGSITQIVPSFNNPDTSLYTKVQAFLTEEKMQALYNKGKKEFQHELDALDVVTKEYLLAEGDFTEDDDMS